MMEGIKVKSSPFIPQTNVRTVRMSSVGGRQTSVKERSLSVPGRVRRSPAPMPPRGYGTCATTSISRSMSRCARDGIWISVRGGMRSRPNSSQVISFKTSWSRMTSIR